MEVKSNKNALKGLLGVRVEPKYTIISASSASQKPINSKTKSSLFSVRKKSLPHLDSNPARVKALAKPLNIPGHKKSSNSEFHLQIIEEIEKQYPIFEEGNIPNHNFRVGFKQNESKFSTASPIIKSQLDASCSFTRIKSFLDHSAPKKPFSTLKEPERQRFSQFLKTSYEMRKETTAEEISLKPGSSNIFAEKLSEPENVKPGLNYQENRDVRRIFRRFLADSNSYLLPKKLEEAFERDQENVCVNAGSKSRLFEVKPVLRSRLIELKYNPKKRKFHFSKQATLTRQMKINRIRFAIDSWVSLLQKNGIQIAEGLKDLVNYPKKPFFSKGSYFFMRCVKENKIHTIRELLLETPSFLQDFDFFSRSGLHWVCDLGLTDLLDLFLEYPGFLRLNMKDIDGKTPLYLACKAGFLEIVKKLLYAGACPWSFEGCTYNEQIFGVEAYEEIRKARKIEIMMRLARSFWQKNRIWREKRPIFLVSSKGNKFLESNIFCP